MCNCFDNIVNVCIHCSIILFLCLWLPCKNIYFWSCLVPGISWCLAWYIHLLELQYLAGHQEVLTLECKGIVYLRRPLFLCILCCCCLVAQLSSNLLWLHGLWPTRLLCPWNFPGKNTRMGCHFLLQGIFLTQGLNLYLLHWPVESLPLSHQGSLYGYSVYTKCTFSV